jgi:WD40 repeat protein
MTVYDGKLFSYSMDGTIKIGDLKSNQELLTLNLRYETNSCFAFCNGKLIVGLPSMIKIWDFNPVLKENHNL